MSKILRWITFESIMNANYRVKGIGASKINHIVAKTLLVFRFLWIREAIGYTNS